MSTFTQIYYHIVFSTKNREFSLKAGRREDLFRYMWGAINNNNCHLYRLNGVDDHIHIFTSLHPTVSLADLVKDIKISSSKWIKENGVFHGFTGWQDGYSAFTHSHAERNRLIEYIKEQNEHHARKSFKDELKELLAEAGIEFDEKYLV